MSQFREITVHFAAFAFTFASMAQADPLPDPDNGGLSGMFTLPVSTEGATLPGAGQWVTRGNLFISSHSMSETSLGETLVLDGETTRLEFDVRYGLSRRIELGIRVPYVWHERGTLDSLVEDWHRALGLSQGGRETREKDLLQFSYRDASGQIFDYRSRSDGIGDVRLIAGYQLTAGSNYRSALRVGVKLPTGDPDEFHGSGGTDFSIGIAGDWDTLLGQQKLSAYYRLHLNMIGEPDRLADRYEETVWQVSTGLGYQVAPTFELRAQAVARTANYNSKIETLGQNALWMMFGANINIGNDFLLSLGVAEDVKVRSAPDVSFQVGLRYQPGESR